MVHPTRIDTRKIPSREAPKFVIRFDSENTRDQIQEIARQRRRSANSEVLEAIAKHVAAYEGKDDADAQSLAARIATLNKADRELVENLIQRLGA